MNVREPNIHADGEYFKDLFIITNIEVLIYKRPNQIGGIYDYVDISDVHLYPVNKFGNWLVRFEKLSGGDMYLNDNYVYSMCHEDYVKLSPIETRKRVIDSLLNS